LEKDVFLLDLNQGPTNAFKDFGANTLAALMNGFLKTSDEHKTILAATSGDTGAAVANAFKDYSNNPNIDVVILYPKGQVSKDQRLLMTTIGGNVKCLEVQGNFDDCQAMVKLALSELKGLTSANSINIGRIFGQIVYPFYCYANLPVESVENGQKAIFSVPSGNLGNSTSVRYAQEMGLPVEKIILAHNSNGPTEELVLNQILKYVELSDQTMSSAMDVSKPNNTPRILDFYNGKILANNQIDPKFQVDFEAMQNDFFAKNYTDEQTANSMLNFYVKYQRMIDPHTAVAKLGLDSTLEEHPEYDNNLSKIIYSTADAAKFPQECELVYGELPVTTEPIQNARSKKEYFEVISNRYDDLKDYLVRNNLANVKTTS
jgi:threonine synthase